MNAPTIEDSYTAYGNIGKPFTSKAPELVLSGPAGTGKSRGILEYLNYCAMDYTGARILMVRKTRRSLTESGMVTLEQKVLHPAQGVRFKSSVQQYQYPNSSIIAVGGLDKPEKILSSEWDIIYPQEATELDEADWEMCGMRLRNGKTPLQRLIGDCNPGPQSHWIKQRASSGKTLMFETRHEDNPVLFTRDGQMTAEGQRYLSRLDELTGVRYMRYRLGLWVSAEGMIYEDSWDPARNIVNRSQIPPEWPRFLAVDFGFTHPFVCLWGAQDPDGRLYIYRQIYKTKTLVEDHAKEIKRVSRWGEKDGDPLPRAIICDHDAEDRATLERHLGLVTMKAHKGVSDGIQAVASRFRSAGDGKPRLVVLRDGLVERDRDLVEHKQPTCLEDEPEGYVWDVRQGMKKGEAPVKENDHACLVAGTLITTNCGDVPIEQIQAGDYVLTRNGYRRVAEAGITTKNTEVYTVAFSNGATLTGTGNHPVYRIDKGYTPLHALRYNDIIEDINSSKERYPQLCQSLQQKEWSLLFTKGSRSGVIPNRLTGQMPITIARILDISKQASSRFTSKYGKMLMDLCRKVVTSTTETETHLTILWTIWNALQQRLMQNTIRKTTPKNGVNRLERILTTYDHLLQHGTNQKRAERGIVLLRLWHGLMQNIEVLFASNVATHIKPGNYRRIMGGFAPIIASQRGGVMLGWTMKPGFVSDAGKSLYATNTLLKTTAQKHAQSDHVSLILPRKQEPAQYVGDRLWQERAVNSITVREPVPAVAVCFISKNERLQSVYNLTVENPDGEGEYFANGVLVHNCDALRYLIAHFDVRPTDVHYSSRVY